MRILSCVPEQRFSLADKIKWLDSKCEEFKPDIFVTPQELFGGIQNLYYETGEPLHYHEEEVIEPMLELARKHDVGFYFGALIKDRVLDQVRERIYGIDPEHGMTGYQDKIHLPGYDHIEAKGKMRVSPETDYRNRITPIEVKGVRAGVLFCWEAYSSPVWYHIALGSPDLVVSMIKFGVASYPIKKKDPETGEHIVTDFGYGGGEDWMERLKMAARFDLACPIVCSTNSWNLKKRARPLCGTVFPYNEGDTLTYPPKGAKGTIEETMVLDEFDPLVYRLGRKHITQYRAHFGEWPKGEMANRVMFYKVWRNDRKYLGIKEEKWKAPKTEDRRQMSLFES